jgi:hypothetical protein
MLIAEEIQTILPLDPNRRLVGSLSSSAIHGEGGVERGELPMDHISAKIQESIQQLPERAQIEVLDFVEFLVAKNRRRASRADDTSWSQISLSLAMRGMEDEEVDPEYTRADLKDPFS